MTLFQKVDKVCRHGFHAVVTNGEKEWMIVNPYKDGARNWRESYLRRSLDSAAMTLGSDHGANEDEWNEREGQDWQFHSIYKPEYERFKVGDEVKWRGDVYEITGLGNDGSYSLTGLISPVPHFDLEPIIEEDKVVEMTVGEVAKKLGMKPDKLRIKE